MESGRNLLSGETSPYLLQHARKPAWSAEALAEAARRDCPILLSIGYAACHWRHVMAHESFVDAPSLGACRQIPYLVSGTQEASCPAATSA